MIRTQKRPLPDGRLLKFDALLFGSAVMLTGVAYLAVFVNPFTALLIAATGGLYLFLYTPLKRTTSFNSVVGAVPGAMPPVIGWAAATGALSIEAFVVFCDHVPLADPPRAGDRRHVPRGFRESGHQAPARRGPRRREHGQAGRLLLRWRSFPRAWRRPCSAWRVLFISRSPQSWDSPIWVTAYTWPGKKGLRPRGDLFYYSLIYLPALLLAMIFG